MGFNEVNCKEISRLCGSDSKGNGKKGRYSEAAYRIPPTPEGEGKKQNVWKLMYIMGFFW